MDKKQLKSWGRVSRETKAIERRRKVIINAMTSLPDSPEQAAAKEAVVKSYPKLSSLIKTTVHDSVEGSLLAESAVRSPRQPAEISVGKLSGRYFADDLIICKLLNMNIYVTEELHLGRCLTAQNVLRRLMVL